MAMTEQVDFWQGAFGNDYTKRNLADKAQMQVRLQLWSQILSNMISAPPSSIAEIGANLGINLRALRHLSSADLIAVEPNASARQILIDENIVDHDKVFEGVAANLPLEDNSVDMAFTSGVLIHIHPDQLSASIEEIYRISKRWIVCIEYFADKPEMIPYRGHDDRLFKRDFGGFWLDNFPQLRTVAYGFAWKRITGLDNLTWWIFEKPTL